MLELFAGVTHIIHAGDDGDPAILVQLAAVAPVTAVAGNRDPGKPASRLPLEAAGEVAGVSFVVGHKRKRLVKALAAGRIKGWPERAMPDLVVDGHDHTPATAWVEGTLYLNPGSASAPEEEDDDPTVAIVEITPAGLAASFFPLERQAAGEARRGGKESRRAAGSHEQQRAAAHEVAVAQPTEPGEGPHRNAAARSLFSADIPVTASFLPLACSDKPSSRR